MSKETNVQSRQANFYNVCGACPIGCCSGARPPLTSRRRRIIQEYLDSNQAGTQNPFQKDGYTFPRETNNNCCVFQEEDTKKCRIQSVKPETCVGGPVTFDINLETRKIEYFLKTEKICPLAGLLYKDKTALNSHFESARRELRRLVHELDTEELNVILKIEEPDTFKIGEEDLDAEILKKLNLVV